MPSQHFVIPRLILAITLFTILILAFICAPVLAAESIVSVTVSDAITKAPIYLAKILLEGPVAQIGYTDDHGRAHFDDVIPGQYFAVIIRSGYSPGRLTGFVVSDGSETSLAVSLAPASQLKIISTVRVSGTSNRLTSTNAEAPSRRLSDSLASSLGQLSGVAIASNADGEVGSVSLYGHQSDRFCFTPERKGGPSEKLNA